MYKTFLPVFLTLLSCTQFSNKGDDKIIARVHEEYLYLSEIEKIIPDNLNKEDSVLIAEDYTNKWVRKQLLLFKAKINLTEEEKEVERQIEEYRASLLIFKYEQKYLNQSLDTSISIDELKSYYDDYGNNFMLDRNIIKGKLIKIPNTSENLSDFRRNIRYRRESAAEEIDLYCRQYADEYSDFSNYWIDFNTVAQTLPKAINNTENYLRYRKFDEMKDTTFHYFLSIDEFRLANNIAPFEYVEQDIRSILINKRKVKLVNELEAGVYNEGLNHSYFNIY